jgi:hypothetical protein
MKRNTTPQMKHIKKGNFNAEKDKDSSSFSANHFL